MNTIAIIIIQSALNGLTPILHNSGYKLLIIPLNCSSVLARCSVLEIRITNLLFFMFMRFLYHLMTDKVLPRNGWTPRTTDDFSTSLRVIPHRGHDFVMNMRLSVTTGDTICEQM